MDLPLGAVHYSRRTTFQSPWTHADWDPMAHNPTTISPIRLPTRATTNFEYLVRKALDASVQYFAMVHMLVPKHSREEEADVSFIEN